MRFFSHLRVLSHVYPVRINLYIPFGSQLTSNPTPKAYSSVNAVKPTRTNLDCTLTENTTAASPNPKAPSTVFVANRTNTNPVGTHTGNTNVEKRGNSSVRPARIGPDKKVLLGATALSNTMLILDEI